MVLQPFTKLWCGMFNIGDIVELDDYHKYYKYSWWSMRFHTFVVHKYREHEVVIESINNGLTPVVPIQALQLVNHKSLPYEEMM